jgi:L-fuconolactonase
MPELRVDAHHHVWRLARGDYGWLTPDKTAIYRDFGLDDLRPHLKAAGIGATVLVQAAPTEAETEFMLEVARSSGGLVRGVVGWTDLAAPGAAARVAALPAEAGPLLKGLRPMLHDIADPEWILRPEVQPALRAMAAAGLRFDALIRPVHLPVMLELARRHPDLPIVIDHGAKPEIARGAWEPWAGDIARIARETPAFCKLSGLVTEAARDWRAEELRRYVDHLLAAFGPARLMWGSDWPVVDLAGGYAAWREATGRLLPTGLSAEDRAAIMGGTATRFYGLGGDTG